MIDHTGVFEEESTKELRDKGELGEGQVYQIWNELIIGWEEWSRTVRLQSHR